ncbi:C-type natriuretic peptide [Catharus ustulatus]|uniref:C-type natriuretic peptide n=1 Tax=Catharus ustulatus TaxID=91951 RepID=UPI00140981ED|nr:C-type natriuretic peptide [Catharus ustulatus]XP_059711587.1 C-type natriuretic peptide [Haemorhous mexicanus]
MQISPLLAGGLLLALLSVRLEAKPASQLPQKASRGSAAAAAAGPPEAAEREKEREKERSGGGGGSGPREAREARAEARPRAGWARLLQDPPGRRHKGLHKKGLGKGCFGLKLDRIGAMSGLGC